MKKTPPSLGNCHEFIHQNNTCCSGMCYFKNCCWSELSNTEHLPRRFNEALSVQRKTNKSFQIITNSIVQKLNSVEIFAAE